LKTFGLKQTLREIMGQIGSFYDLKNLKNNKSPGCDGITAELYKMFD